MAAKQLIQPPLNNNHNRNNHDEAIDTMLQAFFEERSEKTKNRLYGACALIGLLFAVPFFQKAMEYAGDNQMLGYTYVGAEAISLGLLNTWLLIRSTTTMSDSSIASADQTDGKCSHMMAFMFSLIMSGPSFWIGYKMSDTLGQTWQRMTMAILAGVPDIISGIFTFSEFREKINHRYTDSDDNRQRIQSTQQQITHLEKARRAIPNIHYPDLQALLQHRPNVTAHKNDDEETQQTFKDLWIEFYSDIINISHQSYAPHIDTNTSCGTKSCNMIKWIFAILLPSGTMITINRAAYRESRQFTKNKTANTVLSVLPCIPAIGCSSIMVYEALTIMDTFRRHWSINNIKHAGTQSYRIQLAGLSMLSFMIAMFSIASRAWLIDNLWDDENLRRILRISGCTDLVFSKSYALINMSSLFLLSRASRQQPETSPPAELHMSLCAQLDILIQRMIRLLKTLKTNDPTHQRFLDHLVERSRLNDNQEQANNTLSPLSALQDPLHEPLLHAGR